MTDDTPVTRTLAGLGVAFRVFRHAAPPGSVEQAAAERGEQPDQVVRSIVFRLAADEYAMVLMPGVRQVSWKTLRRHFGQSRLTMASPEEVLGVTGYPLGAVAPFGLPGPMRLLVDERVFAFDEVSLGSGVRGVAVILSSSDLRRALPQDVEIGQFGE